MALKLSIFTSLKDPQSRGDTYMQSLNCYQNLADEVIIMNGGEPIHNFDEYHIDKLKMINYKWTREFDWKFIGEQFTRGYNACTGDWVIHADLDYVFHENDYDAIRKACEDNPDAPALSFWKYQLIVPHEYNLKSRLVIAVNKGKYGDRIKFDASGDLCQPSLDGKYINPDDVPEARVPFYNYEKILKTKEQIADDSGRMERAYHRHFGKYQLNSDGNDQRAYEGWLAMSLGRYKSKPQTPITLEDHPKVMHDTLKNLKPEMWGYNGHGHLPVNKYTIQLDSMLK